MHSHLRQNNTFTGLSGGYNALLAASHRFSFNGQERTDEIAGTGNHNTALYWEYDTRLGRRWNLDPVIKTHESPYATFANNPNWFVDHYGADSTTYLFSSIGENGQPLYDQEQLQKIADQSQKLDRLNGINFTKYKVTTQEELQSNKSLNLNPKTDLIFEVTNNLNNPGITYSTGDKYQNMDFVTGKINPLKVGGSLVDAGNVLAHERMQHAYFYIISELFSNGEGQTNRYNNSAIQGLGSGHTQEGIGREFYGASNVYGDRPYSILRTTEAYSIESKLAISALFSYSGGVFATGKSKKIDAYDWGGEGLFNGVYTRVLQLHFSSLFNFKY